MFDVQVVKLLLSCLHFSLNQTYMYYNIRLYISMRMWLYLYQFICRHRNHIFPIYHFPSDETCVTCTSFFPQATACWHGEKPGGGELTWRCPSSQWLVDDGWLMSMIINFNIRCMIAIIYIYMKIVFSQFYDQLLINSFNTVYRWYQYIFHKWM